MIKGAVKCVGGHDFPTHNPGKAASSRPKPGKDQRMMPYSNVCYMVHGARKCFGEQDAENSESEQPEPDSTEICYKGRGVRKCVGGQDVEVAAIEDVKGTEGNEAEHGKQVFHWCRSYFSNPVQIFCYLCIARFAGHRPLIKKRTVYHHARNMAHSLALSVIALISVGIEGAVE